MLNDILGLLNARPTTEMPLVDLFMSTLRGDGTCIQRSRLGHAKADAMRRAIVQVVERYALQTRNLQMLRLRKVVRLSPESLDEVLKASGAADGQRCDGLSGCVMAPCNSMLPATKGPMMATLSTP